MFHIFAGSRSHISLRRHNPFLFGAVPVTRPSDTSLTFKDSRCHNRKDLRLTYSTTMMMKAAPLVKRIPARRFATTWTARESQQPKHPLSLKLDAGTSFRHAFLQDPSVYPLMAILGTTLSFMIGMGAHALLTYKDVQIDPVHRNSILRTWGQEETPSLTKRVTRRATRRMNLEEGLGVDHTEWLKQKKRTE